MMQTKRSCVLAGAAITVVVLGFLTNIATNLLPEGYLPQAWIVWTALIAVALTFIAFSFINFFWLSGAIFISLEIQPTKTR